MCLLSKQAVIISRKHVLQWQKLELEWIVKCRSLANRFWIKEINQILHILRCLLSPQYEQKNCVPHLSIYQIFKLLVIYFKILLLVNRALNSLWPKYTSDLQQHLRSSRTGLLSVPRARTKHGETAFSFYAPHIWSKPRETFSRFFSLFIVIVIVIFYFNYL